MCETRYKGVSKIAILVLQKDERGLEKIQIRVTSFMGSPLPGVGEEQLNLDISSNPLIQSYGDVSWFLQDLVWHVLIGDWLTQVMLTTYTEPDQCPTKYLKKKLFLLFSLNFSILLLIPSSIRVNPSILF